MKTIVSSKKNPVARNIEKFNRPSTHMDKKKESKKTGITTNPKHQKGNLNDEY